MARGWMTEEVKMRLRAVDSITSFREGTYDRSNGEPSFQIEGSWFYSPSTLRKMADIVEQAHAEHKAKIEPKEEAKRMIKKALELLG